MRENFNRGYEEGCGGRAVKEFIQINPLDNVAVALQDLASDCVLTLDNGSSLVLRENIARGHKIALSDIPKDADIIKYGNPIGHALQAIVAGSWVHNHNIKTNLSGVSEYSYSPNFITEQRTLDSRQFMGYKRWDGRVGIRNELWIIPTVGCVNGTATQIKQRFLDEIGGSTKLHNVDCINVLAHNYGCSQLGDDHANTRKILAAAAKHPNCGGALVVGLGCENNTMAEFIGEVGVCDESRIKFMISQEVSDEISAGVKLLHELYAQLQNDTRTPCPLSDLVIGLKCGASDGLSGITANPLVGAFSDLITANGGATILTEVPEMFGAEHLLMQRAANHEIYAKLVSLINDFKAYFLAHQQPVYENPSPGNKAGGISTLEDKSLGCTQKSGSAIITDVLQYGEQLTAKGLNILNAPGNDLVASTALAASGCQLVLFTTGRGTPFGSIVPTVKIATNSRISQLKPKWIDFNAGKLLEDSHMEQLVTEFCDYILEVVSGKLVNNELNHAQELAIFKSGVTL